MNKLDNYSNEYDEDVIDLYELWQTIWSSRKFIICFCSIIVVFTAVISLIMTPIFRSSATVMPISSKKGMLSGMGDIAGLMGLSMGGQDDVQTKVMVVLESRSLKEDLIKKMGLIKILFDSDIPEDRNPLLAAIEKFEDSVLNVSSDKKTGLITVSMDHEDPKLAMEMANTYISLLKDILNTKSLSVNKLRREFLEKQLRNSEMRLKKGQKGMTRFQKRTKMIEPMEQARGAMEIYAQLFAKKTALEVEVNTMKAALSPSSPMLRSLNNQIKALDQKIKSFENGKSGSAIPSLSDAPAKMAKYAEHYRELEVSKTIYTTLLKLYEQARLEEASEELFVQVIDPAIEPDRKEKPKRALMVIVAGFTSLFLAVFIVFFREWIKNIKEEHA